MVINCAFCSKEFKATSDQIYSLRKGKSVNLFCSRSCSASFNNSKRIRSDESKHRTSETLKLKNTGIRIRSPQYCVVCCKEMYPVNRLGKPVVRNTCGNIDCLNQRRKEASSRGGRKTASLPWASRTRSKNERYLASLLSSIFPNALFNKRMFGEYDSDIILPDQKIAVHWNGPFHYKPLLGNDHLDKIQKRDALRYAAIASEGFYNYIIDDSGNTGFNRLKVEAEFNLLLKYIEENGTSGGTRTHTTPVSPS